MIITMEVPDDFHILNIGLVDTNDRHAVTRSFTKCELIEMDQYIEKEEFTSFPADVIDDTIDAPDDKEDHMEKCQEAEGIGCVSCPYGPGNFEEYTIAQNDPTKYCPDAYSDRAQHCGYRMRYSCSLKENEELVDGAAGVEAITEEIEVMV